MTGLEFANVVGMITYQQELDLAAHAEMFNERDEITYVTYEPADNHRADYVLAGGKYPQWIVER